MKARSKITRDRRKAARRSPIAAGLRSLLSPRATPAAPRSLREHLRFEPLEPRLLLNADPVLVTGAIDSPGESDRYSFTLDGDTRIAFDSLTNDANIHWTLEGPSGTEVESRGLAGVAGENNDLVLDLKAGEYRLTLDGVDDATGAYNFRLLSLADSLPTTPGTPTSGQLATGPETETYQFAATAGERFYLEVVSLTGPDARWELLDPLGRSVFDSCDNVRTDACGFARGNYYSGFRH